MLLHPSVLFCSLGDTAFFDEDKAIYEPYPNQTEVRVQSLSGLREFVRDRTFNMVHLFGEFAADGTIGGEAGIKVLQVLTDAGCKLVLFASPNSVESYIAAFPQDQRRGIDNIHMVLTLDRKEDNFASFFKAVFASMAQGKSFPLAWVGIAPQHNGPWMEKLPETIAEMGQGQLLFLP